MHRRAYNLFQCLLLEPGFIASALHTDVISLLAQGGDEVALAAASIEYNGWLRSSGSCVPLDSVEQGSGHQYGLSDIGWKRQCSF